MLACEVLSWMGDVAYHGAGLERCDEVVGWKGVRGYQREVRLRRVWSAFGLGVYGLVDW
jgi:hypothetical protein